MFSALICHHCKQCPRELVFEPCVCGFCQHCSLECKAAHWKEIHGVCCPMLQQLRQITEQLDLPAQNHDEQWFDYRNKQVVLTSLLFGGQMPTVLQNNILYQQACNFCFNKSADMYVCTTCHSVCYCKEHETQVLDAHRHVCGLLLANQRCGRLLRETCLRTGKPPRYLPACTAPARPSHAAAPVPGKVAPSLGAASKMCVGQQHGGTARGASASSGKLTAAGAALATEEGSCPPQIRPAPAVAAPGEQLAGVQAGPAVAADEPDCAAAGSAVTAGSASGVEGSDEAAACCEGPAGGRNGTAGKACSGDVQALPPLISNWGSFFAWRGCPAGTWSDEEWRCNTLALTWPLSIIRGLALLRDAGAPLPWPPSPTLRLHLLGATSDCEGDTLRKYEEVLHCLPGVQRLEITLVGPELDVAEGKEAEQPKLCAACASEGRSVRIAFHKGSYHEAAQQPVPQPPAPKPLPARRKPASAGSRSSFSFSFGEPSSRKKQLGSAGSLAAPKGQEAGQGAQPKGPSTDGANSASSSCRLATATAAQRTQQAQQEHPRGASSNSGSGGDGMGVDGRLRSVGGSVGGRSGAGEGGGAWEPPHAAFMFNSGLHEDSDCHGRAWLPTVAWLRDRGVPTLLTAYTQEEANADVEVLTRLGCKVALRPQENPSRNEVPLVDCQWRYKVYYVNGWLLGFWGRS